MSSTPQFAMARIAAANIVSSLLSVQQRIASSSLGDTYEHVVRVSVSVSDFQGNVLGTIQPNNTTSSRNIGYVSGDALFGARWDNNDLNSQLRRIAVMGIIANYVFGLGDCDQIVINVTFQDTKMGWTGEKPTMDYCVQVYKKDGLLVAKETDVKDNSPT